MYFPAGFFFFECIQKSPGFPSELFGDVKDDAAFDVLIRIMQKEVPRQKPVGYCEEGARMLKNTRRRINYFFCFILKV